MVFHRNAIKLVFITTKKSPNKGSFLFRDKYFHHYEKNEKKEVKYMPIIIGVVAAVLVWAVKKYLFED
jgi:hypothetical protein